MKKHILKASMLSVVTAVVIGLTACSSSDGGATATTTGVTSSSGSATKGPFKEGSLVVAYKLNADGSRDVNQTTLTTDGRGSFSFASLPWSGPTEFVISGDYLNENTGTYMTLPFAQGLSTVTNINEGEAASANINVLTNIAAKGIIAKMAAGVDIDTAKTESENDVKELFNLNLGEGITLEDLDPTVSTENSEANTQLLLVSSAILNTTNPDQVMEQLATDISDGEIDAEAIAALEEVKTAVATVNLAEVAANLVSADIGVTDIPESADAALSGLLSFDHNISFAPQYEAFRSTVYTSNEVVVDGIYGGSGAISIQNGEYSIDGAPFTTAAGTISNGQTLQLRTTSADTYSTDTVTTLTLGGATITYVVKTKDDPFVADTTPAPMTFTPLFNQSKSTLVMSAPVTVTGINTATDISVVNGEYSLDNGASWTSTAGTVTNDTNVTLRHTTAADGATLTQTTVTIGGVEATFNSYTVADDQTPDVFTFAAAHDVDLNTTVEANATITGINTETPISIEGGEYSLNDGLTWDTNASIVPARSITDTTTVIVRATSATTYETSKEVKVTVGNVVGIFSVTTKPNPIVPDSTPNAFAFNYLADQNRSTDVVSDIITVSGINQPVTATVTNGFMDINSSGNWVTDANVTAGTTIQLKHTTSAAFATETVTTLDIGGVSANFTSKTELEDAIPDAFSFDRNESVSVGDTNVVSNTVTISGINTDLNISVTNGEYSLDNGTTWTSTAGTVSNGTTLTLRQPTVAGTPNTANVTTVTVGTVSALFTTVTLPVAPDIIGTAVTEAVEDTLYTYTPELNATANDVESWSIVNKPVWADFNPITGELSGIARNEHVGVDANVTIIATNATGSDAISFDITVQNTNDAPVALDINATTNEDTVVTVDTSSYVSDVDLNDSYTVSSVSNPAHGVASVSGTSITYTPAANFFGEDTFTYTVTDEANATASATVHVLVLSVPDIAVIGGDLNVSLSEDAGVYNGVITVTDGDINESALIASDINATYGTFHIASDGSWSYTVTDYMSVQALAQGETLSDSTQVTSLDGGTTATVTVTIVGENDAPVVVAHPPVSTKKQVDFNLTLQATDIDNAAVLTLQNVVSSPNDATISFDANGSVTFNAPNAGEYLLSYTFSDEYNATADGNVTITVTNSDAPVAGDDNVTIDEDNNVSIDILANDSDDFTADENLTVELVETPLNGQAVIEANNTVTYIPNANFHGSDWFTYKITDADGGFDEANVTITINSVNDAPVANADSFTILKNTELLASESEILANDSDVDNNISELYVIYCSTRADTNGSVTFGTDTGLIYTPGTDFVGIDTFDCTITDGDLNATAAVSVNVFDNVPPVVDNFAVTMVVGETITGQIQAFDPDDDNLTFSAVSDSSSAANITINEDGTYSVTAFEAGTNTILFDVTDGITSPVLVNFTVHVVITTQNTTNYTISEGAQLTSAEFDALSVGVAIPADTKLYDLWGADFNGTAFERTDSTYLEFVSDGSFIISENNSTAFAHSGNLETGKTSVSMGTSYDAAAKVADFVMLDANMSAADIANEVPFLATLHLPSDAVVYKDAVRMARDEYNLWGPAEDCTTTFCLVYGTLSAMVENNAHGVVAYNHNNYKRLLVFGDDQNLSAGSGTVVEVDMTGVYDGVAPEPLVINPNAGTWTFIAGGYSDEENNSIDMITVTLADGMTDYDDNILFVEQGAVVNGAATNSVYRGDFWLAGSAGIEYRFNESVNAAVQNYFHPVTIDEWITNIQNANNTELNASDFAELPCESIDSASLVALSPLYELSIDRQFEQPAHFNLMQIVFNSDNSVDINVTTDGVVNLYDSETLGYVVDTTENNITLSRTMDDGSTIDVFALKVVGSDSAAVTGLTMPSGANIYTLAGLQLVDEAYYMLDNNATVWDANATAYSGFDANVTNFVTTVADNNYAIDVRYDSNGTMYALLLNNSGGNTVGDVEEINLDTNETFVVGSWEIKPMVAKNVTEDTLLVTLTTNNGYNWSEVAYGAAGGSTLLRGDVGLAGSGGYIFLADSKAAEIIQLNFENQFLLPFTYEELANKLLYGVVDDGSNIFTLSFYDYRTNMRDIEYGTFGFTGSQLTNNYLINDGRLLILDNATGAVLFEIERTSRNDLFYTTTNLDTNSSSTLFYDIGAAESYLNSFAVAP